MSRLSDEERTKRERDRQLGRILANVFIELTFQTGGNTSVDMYEEAVQLAEHMMHKMDATERFMSTGL